MNQIKIAFCNVNAKLPTYKTEHAAGLDLYAAMETIIEPGKRAVISTGIKLAIPIGYEAQIRSRSGLAADYGIYVLNGPGTIDADYRGEIKVILQNTEDLPFRVNIGDRIAQMVFKRVEQAEFLIVSELQSTVRGDNGLGSTGIN